MASFHIFRFLPIFFFSFFLFSSGRSLSIRIFVPVYDSSSSWMFSFYLIFCHRSDFCMWVLCILSFRLNFMFLLLALLLLFRALLFFTRQKVLFFFPFHNQTGFNHFLLFLFFFLGLNVLLYSPCSVV